MVDQQEAIRNTRRRPAANYGTKDFGLATESFQAVLDNPDASNLRRAQAHIAIGALPLLEEALRGDPQPMPLLGQYRNRQALAIAEVIPLLDKPPRTPNEPTFCWSLGLMLVFNSLEKNDRLLALPTPLRCYEVPIRCPWPLTLWHHSRGEEIRLRVSDGRERTDDEMGDLVYLPRHTIPEKPADPNRMLLVRACASAVMGAPNSLAEMQTLNATATNAARTVDQATSKPQTPRLRWPRLTGADMPKTENSAGASAIVDIEPVAMPPLSLEGVSKDTLLSWYGKQANGRPLTSSEGAALDTLLGAFSYPEIASLSTADTLAFNRLRVECAAALLSNNYGIAMRYLADACTSLESLQRTLIQDEDSIGVYETALDLERVKLYEHIASNKTIDKKVVAEYNDGLTELLGEMISELKRTNDKQAKERWLHLIKPALNATIAMCHKDELRVAVPSLPRQQGTAAHPGWDVDVWPVAANGKVALSAYRKLRFVNEGKTVMRQGDVALVPVSLVGQGANSTLLQIIAAATMGKGRARVEKQFALCQPAFAAAIDLAAPKQQK